MRYRFQVFQTQTRAAYCRMLPSTGPRRSEISFSVISDTNNNIFLQNATYHIPQRLRYLFQKVHAQTTTAFYRILPKLHHHVWELFQVVQRRLIVQYYLHWTNTFEVVFRQFRLKQRQLYYGILPTLDDHVWDLFHVVQTKTRRLIVEYYLQMAITFEISFSHSLVTNENYLILAPPLLCFRTLLILFLSLF